MRGNKLSTGLYSRKPQASGFLSKKLNRKHLEKNKITFLIFLLKKLDASLWNKYIKLQSVRVNFGFLLVYLSNDQTMSLFGEFYCLKLMWELRWKIPQTS